MFLSLTLILFILGAQTGLTGSPQTVEQELTPQISAQLPAILNLAQTLSQASWGIQGSDFEDWIRENPLDNTTETLRELLLRFQTAVENHIDSLEENASLDRTFPYFLSNNLKFTVLTAQPFEHILYDCASNYGFIPSGMHFFSNVIDHQHLPSKIYISRSPIYRNVPVPEWQEIVNQNAQQCSIMPSDLSSLL